SEKNSGKFGVMWSQHRLGNNFRCAFPKMSRPECIGSCSINGQRKYLDDASCANYMVKPWPDLPLDLNEGIADVIRKPESHFTEHLEFICRYIESHGPELLRTKLDKTKAQVQCIDADIITWRGVLRQIMCFQYERRTDLRIKATRINGSIYMTKVFTELQLLEEASMSERHRTMASWGFKFEQFVTTNQPGGKPKTNVPVNEAEEFVGMFRCQLNGIRLLYGAEMDCAVSDSAIDFKDREALNAAKFVELKTSVRNKTPGQARTFQMFKSANWWSQSFLVGINTIFAGLRDNEGRVKEICEYDVGEMARHKPWNPAAMTLFLEDFLRKLISMLESIDDPFAVVQVDFQGSQRTAYYKVLRGQKDQFMPDWYRSVLNAKP
ncbi:hypothetical protein KR009_002095, partial [Drosophila setifemur]